MTRVGMTVKAQPTALAAFAGPSSFSVESNNHNGWS